MASALTTTLTVTTTIKENRSTTDAVTHTNPNVSVTRTGDALDARIVDLGTSEETITLATDVSAAAGWVYIKNHDDTNYITVGYVAEATTAHGIRINAGESAAFRIITTATALYMKANTAACIVEVKVWEKK